MEKVFTKYRVYDIKWDTDGNDELAEELPKEMVVSVDSGIENAKDEAVNAASDMSGFCILSASVEEVKER